MELIAAPGGHVGAGEELLIVESMKMEIPVEAPVGGTLLEYLVEPGQAVEEGRVVARIEA